MRRAIGAVVLAVALLGVSIVVGRWESRHNAQTQNARMRAVYDAATSDGLFSKRLKLYRLDEFFDCLDYAPRGRPQDVAAYELCFDRQGRLVQTADRHTGTPVFSSLLEQPSLAAIRVPLPTLVGGMKRLGVCRDPRTKEFPCQPGQIPHVNGDLGAFYFPAKAKKKR